MRHVLLIVTVRSGLGRYVTSMACRVAVRRPDEAGFVRTYGVVGQIEPIQANIRDEASTRRAIAGADAVVNCVGIMLESGSRASRR